VSALKVLRLMGYGREEIERVPTDGQGRIRADCLPELDSSCIILCQVGNVNSGAFDPVREICERARAAQAWVHVDGAFGLWARASDRFLDETSGWELADSWSADGHKWLNTPWDCGLAICRHPEAVPRVMAADAAYLKIGKRAERSALVPELGRRARGIEVWAALRSLGRQGLADLVNRCCDLAQQFAEGLSGLGFELLNDIRLNQVVATRGDPGELFEIIRKVQESGVCWLGPTRWKGRDALRISVSSWRTTHSDIVASLRAIEAAIPSVSAGNSIRKEPAR
jgi:glutamate/tyrosine decarboxylase-like PLP-dependent enzyme